MQNTEGFADKLMAMVENSAKEISERLCKSLRQNSKTPSFRSMPQRQCVLKLMVFFKDLRRIYFCEKPYKEVFEFFHSYAETRYKDGIPPHEAIYALVIIRRHIWIFTESHAPLLTGLDLRRSVESINKMIRIFDHGMYSVIEKYDEIYQSENSNRKSQT